jgi:hypothetical protein
MDTISHCSECNATSITNPKTSKYVDKGKSIVEISQFTYCLDGKTRCEACKAKKRS